MGKQNIIWEKSYTFAIDIIGVYQHLTKYWLSLLKDTFYIDKDTYIIIDN